MYQESSLTVLGGTVDAAELVLSLLRNRQGAPMMAIVAGAHQHRISPDKVRETTWSLVDQGQLELTSDYQFRLPETSAA